MSTWINFKELRSNLNFADVLRHYGVEVKNNGDQHLGFCPLPKHQGQRNSKSFSANLARGIFQCFGCGAKGNVLDFAVLMENLNPESGTDIRKVAGILQKRFGIQTPVSVSAVTQKPAKATPPPDTRPVVVNAPLDFELKRLDQAHPYLLGRGFSAATVAHFGLGFCSRGLLANRVAIPLHDDQGKLVGYAGRLADDTAVTEDNPKYRFPSKRERDGVVYEFKKSLFAYNAWRIPQPVDDLIVVEGFPSVWWLWQLGFANVIGLMGADCSDKQAEIVVASVAPGGRVWVWMDGDAAGERCAQSALVRVSPHRFTRWIKLGEGKQPTDCTRDELARLLKV